jgi:hypothetical protein
MKAIALALSGIILFLACKPVADVLAHQLKSADICCSALEACEENTLRDCQEESNNCGGKICNPFQPCGSCVLACSVIASQLVFIPLCLFQKPVSMQHDLCCNFLANCWHPPKVV